MNYIVPLIRNSDILGFEVALLTSNGSKKTKNIFGGFISLITILLMLSGSLYFVYDFFSRKKMTIISNTEIDPNVSIKNYSSIPFMVRLSANGNQRYPSNYYTIYMMVSEFDESNGGTQIYTDLELEPCDVSEEYIVKKDLLKDIKDVDSYFCPKWKKNFDLKGIYGTTNFSFVFYAFDPCVGDHCADIDLVRSSLASSYFDFVTISNEVQHYSKSPKEETVFKGRLAVSNTIFKRIWIYFETIRYSTDFGYIFEQNDVEEFNSWKMNLVDVDLRNVKDAEFLWVTLTNYSHVTYFSRAYMKAQTLLANIGGIIEGLKVCGMIICYSISNNLMNQELINSVYDSKSSFLIDVSKKSGTNSSMNKQDKNNLDLEKNLNKRGSLIKLMEAKTKKGFFTKAPKQISLEAKTINNISITNENQLINIKPKEDTNANKELKAVNNSPIKNSAKYLKNKSINNYMNEVESDKNINQVKVRTDEADVNNYIINNNNNLSNNIGNDINSNDVVKFVKTDFKLSICNLIDPFLIFLNKNKKSIYEERHKNLINLLKVDSFLSTMQEFISIKELLFNEDQINVIENLHKAKSNTELLSTSFNKLISKKDNAVNNKLVSYVLN